MSTAALVLTALVALLHGYFLVVEMFLWTKPYGRRVFGLTPEKAGITRVLAANQGLYNGFLASGLAWALWRGAAGQEMQVFLLGCVVVAGLYGGATASKRIYVVQALPGALALAATLLR